MKRAVILMTCCLGLLSATTGCEADESAPTHSARNPLFQSSDKDKASAEKRALEAPQRELPTSDSREFPGESKADMPLPGGMVLLADASSDAPDENAVTPASLPAESAAATVPTVAPATAPIAVPGLNGRSVSTKVIVPRTPMPYPADTQPHSVATTMTTTTRTPATASITSPVTTASQPATTNIASFEAPPEPVYQAPADSVAVPGVGYAIDKSWGSLEPLNKYPHRPNTPSKTVYYTGTTLNNPVYYYDPKLPACFDGPDTSTFGPSNGTKAEEGGGAYFAQTALGDYARVVIDSLYAAGTTVALPVLMVKDPPYAQRQSKDVDPNPQFHGSMATRGTIVPYMTPGKVEWQYPQAVNPYAINNQTVIEPGNPTYAPAPENAPAMVPDPFTQPATQPAVQYNR